MQAMPINLAFKKPSMSDFDTSVNPTPVSMSELARGLMEQPKESKLPQSAPAPAIADALKGMIPGIAQTAYAGIGLNLGGPIGGLVGHQIGGALMNNPATAAAAGPAGLAIAAATAVNAGIDKFTGKLDDASKATTDFAVSMAQTVGVPRSITELGGAVLGIVNPLNVLSAGVKVMQTAMLPLLNLDKPGELVKDAFAGIANVGAKLASVMLDMRDPAAMLSQVTAPFVNQVQKFSPGVVERFNLALDNLSASAGRMFEPIIFAATGFANDLNRLYTSMGGPVRELILEIGPPIREMGLEFAQGMMGLVQQSLPAIRQAFNDLKPALEEFGRFVVTASGWVVRGFTWFASEVGPMIAGMVEPAKEFGRLLMEGGRIVREGVGLLGDIGPTIIRTVIAGFTFGQSLWIEMLMPEGLSLASVFSVLRIAVIGAAATLSAMITVIRSPSQIGNYSQLYFDAARRIMTPAPAVAAPARPSGPMTIAAQQARHVGIEDVGLEARRSAFSMGRDPQEETAQNTAGINPNLMQIQNILRQIENALRNGQPIPWGN